MFVNYLRHIFVIITIIRKLSHKTYFRGYNTTITISHNPPLSFLHAVLVFEVVTRSVPNPTCNDCVVGESLSLSSWCV